MLAVNGNLNASQLIERLQLGATAPFPTPAALPVCHSPVSQQDLQVSECACTTAVCGAGMANAHGAVLQALRPIAAVKLPVTVVPGLTVPLNGAGSAAACGANIVSYQWSIVAPANAPALQNAGSALASIPAPVGSGVYQVMLTVTDNAGRVDSALVVIAATCRKFFGTADRRRQCLRDGRELQPHRHRKSEQRHLRWGRWWWRA